jgi:CRP/FNR family transcriptional regulator, nitrogen fixation regulation protein
MQISAQPQMSVRSYVRQPVAPAANPEALNLLDQFGTTLRLSREQEIHPQGAPATHCYRVVSGCVRTIRLMEDGRRQVGEFMLAGEWLGLDDLDSHAFAAEAVTDIVLRRYPRRMVEALAESHPALGRRLRELALTHLHAAQERVVALGRKTALERLASFMLEMDRRMDGADNGMLELPMSRVDVADHLGLTVETVCRVLASLKRDGRVGVSRSGLRLYDRAALRALACETRH